MGEFELIERVRGRLAEAGVDTGPRVELGSGDDAAVVAGDAPSAVSVDSVVDGVHFRRVDSLGAVGRKALASALSDLAAMGAGPGEALVALGLPGDFAEAEAADLIEGLAGGAREWGVALVGGDVVASPVLFVSVTVLGPLTEAPVRRDGARPGHAVVVTGELGGAAAGLVLLDRPEAGADVDAATADALRSRQLEPVPRFAAGRALAANGAAAMIDLSDGLAGDARHLAAASAGRIEVDLARLPVAPGVAAVAAATGREAFELAAAGGEDYELLACIPPDRMEVARAAVEATGVALTAIGEVAPGAGIALRAADGRVVDVRGFEHGAP